jgi:hypothetical protein
MMQGYQEDVFWVLMEWNKAERVWMSKTAISAQVKLHT